MKFTKIAVPVFMSLLLLANAASAAVRPALTRVVALESDKETSIKLINDDKSQDYLVQSWIEDLKGNDKNLPLILTPPLFKNRCRKGREVTHGYRAGQNPSGSGIGLLAVDPGSAAGQ